ncbi:hypothetical protein AMS62_20365 [Bacillus sp. FJAT-18019]|uniref:DUF6985 domain-containing protein n=1 Tax=Paenibacillus solani TaxID=1705565 RepID=A0A0M1P728_9BACL|nr:hypothetical protein [Paenibacillus solani]KOP67337.1 hypothetical protein AMS62_20365 [Bacillus sp. FJAT-18019]KOR90288.1 hypothetical protein AM231_14900 [Paenibacillus solani]
MIERFHLKNVGIEDALDENSISGFGLLPLFQCIVEYHFSTKDMSLEEAELYIHNILNQLPVETINEICKKACEWKSIKMTSDTVDYPSGLAEAYGRDILGFMSVGEVNLYRNPFDRNDNTFGAILSGGTEWDSENGMEIIIRGSKVLEVREYLGYGEFAIWEKKSV